MKMIKGFLLASAAGVFLVGAAAQAGQSTASEREATRQLNIQASQTVQTGNTMAAIPDQAAAPAMAPVALNSLSSPPDKIATARVVDDKGTIVGAVQRVEMDQSGKPTQVEIALLGSNRIIALDSAHLSYDQSNNVVAAALDKSQIGQMPASPQG